MPDKDDVDGERRRLMHKRSIECDGYLRSDGLWEVEARLVDTKPFAQRDHYRGELKPGEPVHDIGLRLVVDDSLIIREAETTMRATPFPTCIEVEPILQRLVGERIGKGWREINPPREKRNPLFFYFLGNQPSPEMFRPQPQPTLDSTRGQ